ncbi:dihydrofolate reductase family protein [Streptomyces bicolor]|uniref:dihydrofolate reductase family protein n=1 Tax=Streptomyces bicolor TaxID=66874 RepID=UPI000A7D0497|nr:hypothetical protein [Streptomyces bicolor]
MRLAIGDWLWQSSLWKEGEPNVELRDELHRGPHPSFRCDELEAMLICSMSVSVDGFITNREGGFGWMAPSEELFRFHVERARELGCYLLGRRLYEIMLMSETDASLCDDELRAEFADVWCALPKVVFSRTLDSIQGNARLARPLAAEKAAAVLAATDKDVCIGGAGLAAAAIRARPRRRAAYVPLSGRRGQRHAVPAAGHRRRSAGPGRDQDVRLTRDLRVLQARPATSPPDTAVRPRGVAGQSSDDLVAGTFRAEAGSATCAAGSPSSPSAVGAVSCELSPARCRRLVSTPSMKASRRAPMSENERLDALGRPLTGTDTPVRLRAACR